MNKEELRIVFMGTPAFAVESLKLLVDLGYNVVGVITMPDKPAGRGYKLQLSPVKEYALEHKLPILQPERLKEESFIDQLKALRADLQIVVAFRMLPEIVWNMPAYGTFNLHASLLPQYRGAAPINWAIIRGEKETGATTFFLTHAIDTGRVILQNKIPITDDDTAGTVHDRLMVMGAEMVVATVDRILDGNLEVVEQIEMLSEGEELKTAPKIFRETCEVHAEMKVEDAHNLVRGLSPYPAAWVHIQLPGQDDRISLKLFETEKEFKSVAPEIVGSFITEGRKKAGIVLEDGVLWFLSVQAPAKKRMSADEWLRGLHL
jgi:methionyl-tRNA formyltransferase